MRGTESRFTAGPANNRSPVWSPDSTTIAFYASHASSSPGGTREAAVYQKAANGTAAEEMLDKGSPRARPTHWSKDGRFLFLDTAPEAPELRAAGQAGDFPLPQQRNDIWVLPLFGDRKRYTYFSTAFGEIDPTLSPDGRWLAYVSNETNRREVYVRSFPTPDGKWTISKDGGTAPVWSRDGKELFFLGADRKLMAVEIRSGAKFEAGAPRTLFQTRMPPGSMRFDVSKDGRFLLPALPDSGDQSATLPLTVVTNWQAGLKK